MKTFVRAVAFATGLVITAAVAQAGGSLKDAPEPVRSCDSGAFGGAYIGLNAGAGLAWAEQSLNYGAEILKDRDTAFVGGGQLGYNWQCGRHVFGLEVDGNFGRSEVETVDGNAALTSELRWFSTMRARYGIVAHDHMMLYVTGGLAVAAVDHSVVGTQFAFSQTDTDTKWGWTIGAGLELARERWTLRAEALYVDLRDTERTYVAGGGCGVVCTGSAKWEDEFLLFRVGLNFKLGAHERHEPLK